MPINLLAHHFINRSRQTRKNLLFHQNLQSIDPSKIPQNRLNQSLSTPTGPHKYGHNPIALLFFDQSLLPCIIFHCKFFGLAYARPVTF